MSNGLRYGNSRNWLMALTAEILELPMGYVRGGAEYHGRNNRIGNVK